MLGSLVNICPPTTEHWIAMKRVLGYLSGTINLGIHIKPSKPSRYLDIIVAYVDDRRLVGGFCVFFGDSLVSWSSKK